MKLTAVLFDLDRTLVDHDAATLAAFSSWLAGYGMPGDDIPAAYACWQELERRYHGAWQAGEISFTQQRRLRTRDLFATAGIPLQAGDLDAVFGQYLAGYRAAWTAFEDAAPALRRVAAAGLRAGVLTNGDQAQQTDKLRATGLLPHCGPVLALSELPAAKPDPRAFTAACRALGSDPATVLMVGDDYEADILGARAAGLPAVHLDRASACSAADHDCITTLGDLRPEPALQPASQAGEQSMASASPGGSGRHT